MKQISFFKTFFFLNFFFALSEFFFSIGFDYVILALD